MASSQSPQSPSATTPTLWQRVKTGGKSGFDKAYTVVDKLGKPVNRLSNKLGSEAFWPTTLDKESDKAARILRSFCKDGFYAEEEKQSEDRPKSKQKVLKKIPTEVIRNAKGLAIFTTMRTGLWFSGAGGAGVLVARKADGTWSPPSGIMLHTAGLGFLVGVDIYDCVVVINTQEALDAFSSIRCTLGSEISVAAGPIGAGGVLDSELHKRQAPIFTYLKSRGFYAGVQIDGTVIIERSDENERFYGQRVTVKEILEGKVTHAPFETRKLLETIRSAQGDTDIDETMVPTEAPPGDLEVDDGHIFGVPDKEDPDPYGVLALEKEGMSIKEAGTQKRASWEVFSFNPAPSSPIHGYNRNSNERPRSLNTRNSWRTSAFGGGHDPKTPSSLRNSLDSTRPTSMMTDSGTQTDDLPEPASGSRHSRSGSRASVASASHPARMQEVPENSVLDPSPERQEAESTSKPNGYTTPPRTPPTISDTRDTQTDLEEDDDAHIEEPVVHSVQTVQPPSPHVIGKANARIVTVPKRVPPKLPPRNPNRSGGLLVVDASPKEANPTPDEEEASAVSPVESKHDSAQEHQAESERVPVSPLERIRVDGDGGTEAEELYQQNALAKVEEEKAKTKESEGSAAMPGGFD